MFPPVGPVFFFHDTSGHLAWCNMSGERSDQTFPTAFMPDGRPAPWVMDEETAIEFLRLDRLGIKKPKNTLKYYRDQGTLKPTPIGGRNAYILPFLQDFLITLTHEAYERKQK